MVLRLTDSGSGRHTSHTCRPSGVGRVARWRVWTRRSRHASQPTVTQTSQIYKSGLTSSSITIGILIGRPKEHRFNSSAVGINPNALFFFFFCVMCPQSTASNESSSFKLCRVLVRIRHIMRKKKSKKRTIVSNAPLPGHVSMIEVAPLFV